MGMPPAYAVYLTPNPAGRPPTEPGAATAVLRHLCDHAQDWSVGPSDQDGRVNVGMIVSLSADFAADLLRAINPETQKAILRAAVPWLLWVAHAEPGEAVEVAKVTQAQMDAACNCALYVVQKIDLTNERRHGSARYALRRTA